MFELIFVRRVKTTVAHRTDILWHGLLWPACRITPLVWCGEPVALSSRLNLCRESAAALSTIKLGAWDTHNSQVGRSALVPEISRGISCFNEPDSNNHFDMLASQFFEDERSNLQATSSSSRERHRGIDRSYQAACGMWNTLERACHIRAPRRLWSTSA